MKDFHFIPVKTNASWFNEHRVFYFQLGARPTYESLLKSNYLEICRLAEKHKLTFVFHKNIVESKHSLDMLDDSLFLNEVANMKEREFYDELERRIFDYQVFDPIYVARRFNESNFIVWGYDAFRLGKNGLRFPFESLCPLDDIVFGEYCEYNPMNMLTKYGVYNFVTQ